MNWNAEMKCTAHDVKKLSTQKLYISRLWHFGKVKGFTYVFKILQKCWMPGLVCVLFLKLMLSKCLNWKKNIVLLYVCTMTSNKKNATNKTKHRQSIFWPAALSWGWWVENRGVSEWLKFRIWFARPVGLPKRNPRSFREGVPLGRSDLGLVCVPWSLVRRSASEL